jgi:hypothetical protein
MSNKKKWNICLEMEKCKLAPITELKVSSSSMMKPLLNQSRRESTLPYLCKEDISGVVASRFICFKYHYEKKLTKNIRPTNILQIYTTI